MKTKAEIIDEILGIYIADPSKRAVCPDGKCAYLTEDGRMCAMGQCLDKNNPEYAATVINNEVATSIQDLDEKLRPEYRGHEVGFWSELQSIHDSTASWDDGGITPYGKNQILGMKMKWCDSGGANHTGVGMHTDHEL